MAMLPCLLFQKRKSEFNFSHDFLGRKQIMATALFFDRPTGTKPLLSGTKKEITANNSESKQKSSNPRTCPKKIEDFDEFLERKKINKHPNPTGKTKQKTSLLAINGVLVPFNWPKLNGALKPQNLQPWVFGAPKKIPTAKNPHVTSWRKLEVRPLKLTFRHGDKQQRRAMSIVRIQVCDEKKKVNVEGWRD